LVVARKFFLAIIYPGCYVLDNGDSYSRLASDIGQAVRFVFPEILVLILLPILDDYSNGCTRAHNFGTVAKIKIMGEPSLAFAGLWFGAYVLFMRLLLEKFKIASWKKNDFEDLDDLLVSFRLRFVIAEDSSYVFTMYYICYNKYIWY
jgi:hypothetical protein